MVRKRRIACPSGVESLQSQEASSSGGGGRGVQHPMERASPPAQQQIRGGIYQGGRWCTPQSQQEGHGGYAGERGYSQGLVVSQPRGGMTLQLQRMPHQQTSGVILDSNWRHRSGGNMTSDHRTPSSYGGPYRRLLSELHQVTQAPYGATMTIREHHHHPNLAFKVGMVSIRAFRWASHSTLDMNLKPTILELVAKDLHGVEWRFRHIYHGQPKRHLLTSGWSTFVSSKIFGCCWGYDAYFSQVNQRGTCLLAVGAHLLAQKFWVVAGDMMLIFLSLNTMIQEEKMIACQ